MKRFLFLTIDLLEKRQNVILENASFTEEKMKNERLLYESSQYFCEVSQCRNKNQFIRGEPALGMSSFYP